MTTQDPITIVLPVYGRPKLLQEALSSVMEQSTPKWKLLIADDGSDQPTRKVLKQWIEYQNDTRIRWVQRDKNLGLFANLNRSIEELESEWILLLCSDDRLYPEAVKTLLKRCTNWPDADLVLSSFDSINQDGSPRPPDNAQHHDQISTKSALIQPADFVPALLRLGSVNGNLTGMAFSRKRWLLAGPFREDWRHAADWEWLLRAAEKGPVLLNREPIASVRTHEAQLSNSNRRSGHELLEVAQVVQMLREHPLLAKEARRNAWAADVMQFQLWNMLKAMMHGQKQSVRTQLNAIHKSAGVISTSISLIFYLPKRLRKLIN